MTGQRRALFELIARGPDGGLQAAEATAALGMSRGERSRVRRVLKQLVREGLLEQHGRRFVVAPGAQPSDGGEPAAERGPKVTGTLRVTPRGHGYVDIHGGAEGVLVEEAQMGGAIDGDSVEVALHPGVRRGRRRGHVVRVLSRGRRRLVVRVSGQALEPVDPRLTFPLRLQDWRAEQRQTDGVTALATIVAYPETPFESVDVVVERVLGEPGTVSAEVERSLWERNIDERFPADALAQVDRLPRRLRPADRADRVDLRDRPFLTIDPLTARDFDDAVAVERRDDGGHRLWVAIADVSHYVTEESAIDLEAQQRGCSVYLPDKAIPMLPPQLSGDLCSLLPRRDRLAMVIRLDLDERAVVGESECMAAVIRSRARLDYPGVAAALEGDFSGKRARYRDHVDHLRELADLSAKLRRRRRRRGSLLDLDLPEALVLLDEDDPARVRNIVASKADPGVAKAYALIEELMIAANEAVGRLAQRHELPAIWRIHAPPDRDALERLGVVLGAYGLSVETAQLDEPSKMSKLLHDIARRPASRPLSYLVLRSLKQAVYHTVNRGHFGLASKAYIHFTSPIRRYPDLQMHRVIKGWLREQGKPAGGLEAGTLRDVEALAGVAARSSDRERQALEVERELRQIYAASLMREHIGDELSGMVVGLSHFGIFVSLEQPFVEGMVRIDEIELPMDFDPARMKLFDRHGKHVIALGDQLRVRVVNTNVHRGRIDLELCELPGTRGRGGDGKGKGNRGKGKGKGRGKGPVRRKTRRTRPTRGAGRRRRGR